MQPLTTSKVITQHGPRDFDATFDGNYVGSFSARFAAEQALNDHALRLIKDGLVDVPLTLLETEPISNYTCISCGDVLPAWRGSYCEACVEWDNPSETPGIDQVDGPADPDPAPGRCRNCGEVHHIQRCPEVLAALFADPDDQPEPWPDAPSAVNWNS